MNTQSVPADNGGAPPTLAQPGVVKAVCRKCRETLTWEGVAEPPICPHCFEPMIITAATGETVEQAIAAAAQALPERVEPVQPTIPGLRPMFNVAAALDAIEAAEHTATDAERRYTTAADQAKLLRKRADDANATLRALIRDLHERRHDARYEPVHIDGPDDGDAHSSVRLADSEDRQPEGQGSTASVVGLASEDAASTAAPLNGTVERHLSDASSDNVTDCSNAGTLAMLHRAGATNITLKHVEVWTEEQVVTARCWADEQIEANANAAPGTVVSVLWPAHVSLAHHGPDVGKHTPKKRTKKTTRRRSR